MNKFLIVSLNFLLFCFINSFAQQDDSRLIFDDTHVARVDITINPASLDWMYGHVTSDSEHVASFRFRNNNIDESIDSIGFRIRGNTSRNAKKKSFKVSFNSFFKGRKFHGVEKLNLNGEHNDPSIIRSKLCFDHFRTLGITASRANHVALYINNKFYGLYINVEHVDDEFIKKNFRDDSGNLWKCLYPADLTYKGNDPNTYINLNNNGTPVYELQTNEEQMNFTQLVRLINVLNNTPSASLPDSLESLIYIPGVLKYFAFNLLTGSWDDYWSLMNNYYLYHEPASDMFYLLPYDYDNTFGIDWSGNNWTNANPYNFPKVQGGARPLAEKLISNPTYRNLYTHFFEFFRENAIKLNLWESRLDSIKQMITPYAAIDTFRTKDYGFTMTDFSNSYSASGYSNQHVKYGIKQFVNLRVNSSYSQLSYQSNGEPIVYKIDYYPKNPGQQDSIKIIVSAYANGGLAEISVKLNRTGSPNQESYPMIFSPVAGTRNVDDADRYLATLPPLGSGGSATFSVYVKDNQNRSRLYPRKGGINIKASSFLSGPLVLNEFLADNVSMNTDPAGEHDDWLELYNRSSSPVLLTGKYLTDNPANIKKWRFTQPNLYLNPYEYLVVWCDEQQTQPGIHTNFKLSKSGEFLALTDTNGTTILDSITFGPQKTDTSYSRLPDDSGNWDFTTPTPGAPNTVVNVSRELFPDNYFLGQNYPNPFNPNTIINYELKIKNFISLKVYDLLGNEVATLVNKILPAGNYTTEFNGAGLPSGMYFYRIEVRGENGNIIFTDVKKMALLK